MTGCIAGLDSGRAGVVGPVPSHGPTTASKQSAFETSPKTVNENASEGLTSQQWLSKAPLVQPGCSISNGPLPPRVASKYTTIWDEHICICSSVYGWRFVRNTIDLDPQWQLIASIAERLIGSLSMPEMAAWTWLSRMKMKIYNSKGYGVIATESNMPGFMLPWQIQVSNAPLAPFDYFYWPILCEYFTLNWNKISTKEILINYTETYRNYWPCGFKASSEASDVHCIVSFTREFRQRLYNPSTWGANNEYQTLFPEPEQMLSIHMPDPSVWWKAYDEYARWRESSEKQAS